MLRPTVGKFSILSRPIVVCVPPLTAKSDELRVPLTVTSANVAALLYKTTSTRDASPKLI